MTVPSPLLVSVSPSMAIVPKKRPLRDEDGGLIIISPSQHEKLNPVGGCDQAWAFRYIGGIKTPDKASALIGTNAHDRLEKYFRFRILPDQQEVVVLADDRKTYPGEVALRFLKRLPTFHPSLLPEWKFVVTLFSIAGQEVRERGSIDLYDPTRQVVFQIGLYSTDHLLWPSHHADGRPIPLVIDHKTTGNFDYVKTPELLGGSYDHYGNIVTRPDPQCTVYGYVALRDHFLQYGVLPDEVQFRWNYAHTSPSKHEIRTTDLRLTADQIIRNLRSLEQENLHALELAESTYELFDFPKNIRACPAYGGCGYGPGTQKSPGLNICRISPAERFRSIMFGSPPPSQVAAAAASLFGAAPAAAPANPFAPAAPSNPFAPQVAAAPANPFAPAAAAAPVAPAANPFAPQAAAAPGNPFAPQVAAAPANPFAPAAVVAPAGQPMANMFAPQGVNPEQTLQTAPAVNTFAPPAAPVAPPAPVARVQIPAHIDPSQYDAYIAHCQANNLDPTTMQARTAPAPVAVVAPVAAAPAKRKRRTKAEIEQARAAGQVVDPNEAAEDDEGGSILITSKALDQMIEFLQSLKR